MSPETELCTSTIRCVVDFQTLLSGILAIFAALVTALVIWCAAYLPIKKQAQRDKEMTDRRQRYVCLVLSTDFQLLASRALQAEGTIKVAIAANTNVTDNIREKTQLNLHPIIDDWESMSLLSKDKVRNILELSRKVNDHNFDMQRAGGAFGADNFRQSILSRIGIIQSLAKGLAAQIEAVNRANT
jgi:hypothetical protein